MSPPSSSPPSLIEQNLYPHDTPWEYSLLDCENSRNDLTLGVDIGRDHDLTVFWLLENVEGTFFTRKLLCLKNTPFAQQEALLYELLALPNLRRTCIDQTGLGRQFAERAIQRFGAGRIEGITFTNALKETLAYTVKNTLEANKLRLPHEKHVHSDLRAIKRETTAAGNLRFAADRGKNGHADRFWALALALHAADNTAPSPYYQSLTRKHKPLIA